MSINGIELGVSLYSFTQRFIEHDEYGIEDMFQTLQTHGVKKYELIGSQVFEQYPSPRASEIDRIGKLVEKYDMTPFSYGGYFDIGRITGRIPTDEDFILDLTADLRTARDLGCSHLRIGHFPKHLVPLIADFASHYGIKIGMEVHAPSKPSDADVQELLAMFDATGSDMVGFIPDFGCFIERPAEPGLQRYLNMGAKRELLDYVIANRHSGVSEAEMQDDVASRGGGLGEKTAISDFFGFLSFRPADLEGFTTLLHRSVYFHSKFYYVNEQLTDPTIPIEALLTDIVKSGFQGVLMSEYEGHAFGTDVAEQQIERHLALETRVLSAL